MKDNNEYTDNILKIDLDKILLISAIALLKNRLSYMHDIHFLHMDNIKKIEIIKKTKHSAKIYLNINLSPKDIIIIQLMLGSDYRKEVNTYLNKFKLNMKYYNRLFTVKRYKNGKVLGSKIKDITSNIKNYVNDESRFRSTN